MGKGYLAIALLLATLMLTVSCSKDDSKDILEQELLEEELLDERDYNYSLMNKVGLEKESYNDYLSKLDDIYDYLTFINFDAKEVSIVLGTYDKVNRSKGQIVVDTSKEFDDGLLLSLIEYNYSDTLNYGLIYGFAHDIGRKTGLDLEPVEELSIESIESHWPYLYLDYVNFIESISTQDLVRTSKSLSVNLVSHLIDIKGYDDLYDLMDESQHMDSCNQVNKEIIDYIVTLNPTFNTQRPDNFIVMSHNLKGSNLEFEMNNIKFKLNLKGQNIYPELIKSMHSDCETFYYYLNSFRNEITRLEELVGFDYEDLGDLTIEIYKGEHPYAAGFYNRGTIVLYDFSSISHEYLHHVDYSMARIPRSNFIKEMRAEYYTIDFNLRQPVLENHFDKLIGLIKEDENSTYKGVNLVDYMEDKYGRELEAKDWFGLFGELNIQYEIKAFGVDTYYAFMTSAEEGHGYPTAEWLSMMRYMIRVYGEEEMHSIMLHEKLLDGTSYNIDKVQDGWIDYIMNLTEENYQ